MADTSSAVPTPANITPSTPEKNRPPRRGIRSLGLRLGIPLTVVACYVLAGVFGPMLVPFNTTETHTGDRLRAPGSALSEGGHTWLGTDDVGRDLLGQVLIGARISLIVAVVTLAIAGMIGLIIGVVAGFLGGKVDAILMRLADVQLAFPSILLAILIASLLGPSVVNVIVTLAVTRWVVFARVARAQTLAVKHREYVDATRVLGARALFLIRRCVLPACLAPLLVVGTVELGMVIIAEASLSFLGLGTPGTSPSWGLTIANGRNYLSDAWWISSIPGIALAILVVACGIVGDELRDRLDPHLKGR